MKPIILAMMIGATLETQGNNLINSLITVESNGNNSAIGDKGKAKGCLQIWDCVIKDVNRIYKKKYTKQDCFNRSKAIEICQLYLLHYGKNYEKKTGKKVTAEILSRIWNGGPDGWQKESTLEYWNKVQKVYNE